MATVGTVIRIIWLQRVALTLVGAAAGFAYYTFVGCEGGCPLTGNPWTSTAYGALVGFLVHPGQKRSSAPNASTPHQPSTETK